MTTTRVTPTLTRMRHHNGTAGQFSLVVDVTYPGEDTRTVEFVGSVYGGPVLMVTDIAQTWVTDPGRFGTFSRSWVTKFFA